MHVLQNSTTYSVLKKKDNFRYLYALKFNLLALKYSVAKYRIDYQSGFVRGKSTSDHIFTIRQTMEKYYEFGKEVNIMCFVDFRQPYDSIARDKLWVALEEFGIPTKLIDLKKACNTYSVQSEVW